MSSLESPRPILARATRQYPVTIASIAGAICRFVINNGEPLMIVQDLLRVLGYKDNRTSDLRKIFDTNQRIHHRNFDEIVIKLPFGRWGISTINEDGLRLVCDLVKPERTQELRRWLEEGGMQKSAVNAAFEQDGKCLDVETSAQAAISLDVERFDQAAAASMTQPDGKCLVNEAFEHQGKFADVGESGAAASPSKVIYLDENHDPDFNLPLQSGDRIRSLHAQRPGSVVRVYHDGSACILWDDGEPQAAGLGHERMPRELLELIKRPDPGAARARRKEYCRELCKIITRYVDDAEVTELARALEGVSASILARRYCPGLNAASYDVFARLGMKGGVQ